MARTVSVTHQRRTKISTCATSLCGPGRHRVRQFVAWRGLDLPTMGTVTLWFSMIWAKLPWREMLLHRPTD